MSMSPLLTGGGKDVLVREIAAIQELLDEQPDSKCECVRLNVATCEGADGCSFWQGV